MRNGEHERRSNSKPMCRNAAKHQLELEEVHILSRSKGMEFRCDRPWACISISTESDGFAEINECNRVDLLQIAFADLEQEPSPLTLEIYPELKDALFTEAGAERILDFTEGVSGRISVLMVHCALGQSRSPAVTAVLLGVEPTRLQGTSPNRLVYELLENCRQIRQDWRGLRCSASGRLFGTELEACDTAVRSEPGTQWRLFSSAAGDDGTGDSKDDARAKSPDPGS